MLLPALLWWVRYPSDVELEWDSDGLDWIGLDSLFSQEEPMGTTLGTLRIVQGKNERKEFKRNAAM